MDTSDKITEFYDFWRDCMNKYYEAVGINFNEFTKEYNMNVIDAELFLWSLVKKGIDGRETYEEDLKKYNEIREGRIPWRPRTWNLVSPDWVSQTVLDDDETTEEEKQAHYDYVRESMYLDDLKDFGKLQTGLLSHYNKDVDVNNLFERVDDIISSLKSDERFNTL